MKTIKNLLLDPVGGSWSKGKVTSTTGENKVSPNIQHLPGQCHMQASYEDKQVSGLQEAGFLTSLVQPVTIFLLQKFTDSKRANRGEEERKPVRLQMVPYTLCSDTQHHCANDMHSHWWVTAEMPDVYCLQGATSAAGNTAPQQWKLCKNWEPWAAVCSCLQVGHLAQIVPNFKGRTAVYHSWITAWAKQPPAPRWASSGNVEIYHTPILQYMKWNDWEQ